MDEQTSARGEEVLQQRRWWTLAFGLTAIILVILNIFTPSLDSALPPAAGFAAIGAMLLTWLLASTQRRWSVAMTYVVWLGIIVASGVAIASNPPLALVQVVLYPFLWASALGATEAIVVNTLGAISVAIGMYFGYNDGPEGVAPSIATAAISLGFSIFMGLWIARIERESIIRGRLESELSETRAEVVALHAEQGAAAERERLSRDLHDTVGQSLAGLVLLVQRARRDLAEQRLTDETLAPIEEGARAALGEIRAVLAATSADGLAEHGLIDALARLADHFRRETGLAVTTNLPEHASLGLDRAREVVLLRCAQEALANVRKHAQATSATLTLVRLYGTVLLTVRDNGRGIGEVPNADRGYGLSGMRERVQQVGGKFAVSPVAAGGTEVLVELQVQA